MRWLGGNSDTKDNLVSRIPVALLSLFLSVEGSASSFLLRK